MCIVPPFIGWSIIALPFGDYGRASEILSLGQIACHKVYSTLTAQRIMFTMLRTTQTTATWRRIVCIYCVGAVTGEYGFIVFVNVHVLQLHANVQNLASAACNGPWAYLHICRTSSFFCEHPHAFANLAHVHNLSTLECVRRPFPWTKKWIKSAHAPRCNTFCRWHAVGEHSIVNTHISLKICGFLPGIWPASKNQVKIFIEGSEFWSTIIRQWNNFDQFNHDNIPVCSRSITTFINCVNKQVIRSKRTWFV